MKFHGYTDSNSQPIYLSTTRSSAWYFYQPGDFETGPLWMILPFCCTWDAEKILIFGDDAAVTLEVSELPEI